MQSADQANIPVNELFSTDPSGRPLVDILKSFAERYESYVGSEADEQVALDKLRADISALSVASLQLATLSPSEASDLVVSAFSLSVTRSVVQTMFSVWRRDAEGVKSARQSSSFRIARIESELSAAEQLLLQCVKALQLVPGESRARETREAVTQALAACERCAADLRESVSAALVALISQDSVFASDESFRVLADDALFYVTRLVALLSRSTAGRPAPALLSAVGL